ncbi:MAG: recombinase family protein [Vicingaceae bacterium]
MRVKYVRISSIGQNPERQQTDEKEFDRVLTDTISGTVPFFERPKGKIIKEMLEEERITELHIQSIDRLGRNLISTLQTIETFNSYSVAIVNKDLGLRTYEKGKINPSVNLMIQLMSMFGEMENSLRKERQREGIEVAKMKGVYKGRKNGTNEDTLDFLSKPKNKRALELLKRGDMSQIEIARSVELHPNTILKIKKFGLKAK